MVILKRQNRQNPPTCPQTLTVSLALPTKGGPPRTAADFPSAAQYKAFFDSPQVHMSKFPKMADLEKEAKKGGENILQRARSHPSAPRRTSVAPQSRYPPPPIIPNRLPPNLKPAGFIYEWDLKTVRGVFWGIKIFWVTYIKFGYSGLYYLGGGLFPTLPFKGGKLSRGWNALDKFLGDNLPGGWVGVAHLSKHKLQGW